MSYSKIMRNITSALMMRKVNCGQHKWNVWSLDGNINYLSSKHKLKNVSNIIGKTLAIELMTQLLSPPIKITTVK